jgi:hypothetical protein
MIVLQLARLCPLFQDPERERRNYTDLTKCNNINNLRQGAGVRVSPFSAIFRHSPPRGRRFPPRRRQRSPDDRPFAPVAAFAKPDAIAVRCLHPPLQ